MPPKRRATTSGGGGRAAKQPVITMGSPSQSETPEFKVPAPPSSQPAAPPPSKPAGPRDLDKEHHHTWKFEKADLISSKFSLESQPFYMAGIPWMLKARAEKRDDLDVFFVILACLYEDKGVPWELQQQSKITLRNPANPTDDVPFTFNTVATPYSPGTPAFSSFHTVNYQDVINENRGYLVDGKLQLDLAMKVKSIGCMTQWEPIDFSVPGEGSDDVVLVVEEQKLHVSRNLLSIHSPFFSALFFGRGFTDSGLAEFPLADVTYNDFVQLLHVIYPCNVQINHITIHSILALADRYVVQSATQKAERYLLDTERVVNSTKLLLSDQYRLARLQRACLHQIQSPNDVKVLESQSSWKKFSLELRSAVLDRILAVTPKVDTPPA